MDDEEYIPYTMVPATAPTTPAAKPEPEATRALPLDAADSGESRDDDFEAWYRTKGFRLFGTGKTQAQQWYEWRKRTARPKVAALQDMMDKAMRVS